MTDTTRAVTVWQTTSVAGVATPTILPSACVCAETSTVNLIQRHFRKNFVSSKNENGSLRARGGKIAAAIFVSFRPCAVENLVCQFSRQQLNQKISFVLRFWFRDQFKFL